MRNIYYTVEINLAANPEVASLLLQIETLFQSRNGVTKLAACTRPFPTFFHFTRVFHNHSRLQW